MKQIQHPYIVVAGVMGSGKTTIAKILGEALGAHVFEEEFEENAFLSRFYKDMQRWALHCQLFYLTQKITQAFSAKDILAHRPVVHDAPAGQDLFIYALNRLGFLSAEEYALLENLFKLHKPQLPHPDIYIVIRISDELLSERIQTRGRIFEQGVTREYLRALQDSFDAWTAQFPKERTFELMADAADIQKSPTDREAFVNDIMQRLAVR